jgi:predicted nucleotidyltransferase
MKPDNNKILDLIRKKIHLLAPDARAILFGSRARDDANPASDWDILILLNKEKIKWSDHNTIAYPLFELGWKHDQNFSVKLYTKKEWANRYFTPFYKNVEKEGITL